MKFYEVKCVEPSYTLKKRKSQKKLARVYAYTPAYKQIREGGGRSAPRPPSRIGFKSGLDFRIDEMYQIIW